MTEAERLLKESVSEECPRQTGSPAERYLRSQKADDIDETVRNAAVSSPEVSGDVAYKVVAVVVFIVLILIGTYFARVSGRAFLGYIIGAMAFIIAPKIWNCCKRK